MRSPSDYCFTYKIFLSLGTFKNNWYIAISIFVVVLLFSDHSMFRLYFLQKSGEIVYLSLYSPKQATNSIMDLPWTKIVGSNSIYKTSKRYYLAFFSKLIYSLDLLSISLDGSSRCSRSVEKFSSSMMILNRE